MQTDKKDKHSSEKKEEDVKDGEKDKEFKTASAADGKGSN